MQKLNGESLNIIDENITKLKELFPDVFSEGKIDFEALEATLGAYVEREDERYSFNWNGKAKARRIAQTPSTGTLRPAKEESKDWDTTQNLYIEGDNLEVLKLLQKSYHKKVKMIYIDPPYNTGKDFVYKDNFRDNIKNYMQITGQVDSEGNRLSTNSETNGRYHSDWLNMMYPRLKLARNLLKDDGVIFISIDDNEVANLRKLCDEIFGEDNFVAEFVWQKKKGGGNDSKYVATEHEYLLMFAKNKSKLPNLFQNFDAEYEKRYSEEDEFGKYFWDTFKRKSGKQYYPITCPDGTILQFDENGNPLSWLRSEARFYEDLKNNEIKFEKNNSSWSVFFKQRKPEGKTPRSLLTNYGTTSNGSSEILELFKKDLFENPKPIQLLTLIVEIGVKQNDIILDFFSGSATTAHAVMKLNSEDGGNRKFICVQLPETTDEKSEAFKAGYKNICKIGKERIRRAGEKVKSESGKSELDIGFKVLKLDSSNIKTWDAQSENLEQTLFEAVNNIKSDRTAEDLLYEILLKYGLDLTVPTEELELAGKKVYVIGYGALVVCLDEAVTLDTVEAIAKLKEQYQSDDLMRVVFQDNGFKDAEVKTNAIQILKQFGIDDVKSV